MTRLCIQRIEDGEEPFTVHDIHSDASSEEFLSFWNQFSRIAAGLTAHVPGLPANWLERFGKLPAADRTVTI